MNIDIIPDSYGETPFNTLVYHPLQSWQWEEARKKMGIPVYRFGEFDGKMLKTVYQLTVHRIPFSPFSIGYIPRSPFPTADFTKYLINFGRKNNIIFVKFEPNVIKSDTSVLLDTQNKSFIKSPHPLFPIWTQIIDISKSEEQLLAQMKQKTRYNVRLAQKKGVVIREMSNDEGFIIFSKLYFETCRRQRYHGHNRQYHQIIWDSLKNGIAHILVAWYNNVPIAAYELFHFKNTMYYIYGGTSQIYKKVMGANLLMWESILFAKKLGASLFDMWGSLPPKYNSSHDWAGFTRFKEGYGTRYQEYIEGFDLRIKPFLYFVYGILFAVRQKLLRLF